MTFFGSVTRTLILLLTLSLCVNVQRLNAIDSYSEEELEEFETESMLVNDINTSDDVSFLCRDCLTPIVPYKDSNIIVILVLKNNILTYSIYFVFNLF
jgi:hypothetical protein